jgi:nucleoside-triphosphatase THEP1
VAFQVFDLGDGREAILCSSGRICHIVRLDDGNYTVEEDELHRIFPSRRTALDCAREIAGDPDLPPLSQI